MKRRFFPPILLFLLSFALFSPSVGYRFVSLDDPVFIYNNPIVCNGFSWKSLGNAFTALHGDRMMYTPLLWISFLLDSLFWGSSPYFPWGYHLTNVLLHAANAILLYFILHSIVRRPWLAFFTAAFWAFHPLRVESVAWVTERKDTLSTFFAFLSILFYLKAWGRGRPALGGGPGEKSHFSRHSSLVTRHCGKGYQCLALVAFAAGILSKPMLVTLPFLFLLFDFWPLRRFPLRDAPRTLPRLALEKWAFFLLSALCALLTRFLQTSAVTPISLLRRISWLPSNYVFYLAKSFWPSALVPMHPGFPVTPVFLAASSLLLLALAVIALSLLRPCPGFPVGLAAFAGLLFPVSGIVFIGIYPVADRYSYLPSLGLSIALASLLQTLFAPPAGRTPATRTDGDVCTSSARPLPLRLGVLPPLFCILMGALLAAEALVTSRILPTWRKDDSIYVRLARFFPNHHKVLEHQYHTAFLKGDFDRAADAAARLHAILPRDAHTALALLTLRARTLSSRDALDAFFATPPDTSLDELRFPLNLTLAILFADVGQPERAMEFLSAARPPVPLAPVQAVQFHNIAAWVADAIQRPDLALEHLRALPSSTSLSALSPEALLQPAAAVWNLGLCPQALPSLRKIARDASSNSALLNNVAWILATTPGSPAPSDEAIAIASRALMIEPANPVLQDTLAAALANAGRFDEAIALDSAAADSLAGARAGDATVFLSEVQARLELYRNGVPYTENTAAAAVLSVQ
jgi:tetratricopeptide (TPR) repeat protein